MTDSVLEALLTAESEALEVEYKAWLDTSEPEVRAKIARHLAALANHGGERAPRYSKIFSANILLFRRKCRIGEMLYGILRPEPGTAAGRFQWSRLGRLFSCVAESKNDRMSSAEEMHYTTYRL